MNHKKCCILDIRTRRTKYCYYYFEAVEIDFQSGSRIKLDAASKLYLLQEDAPASIHKIHRAHSMWIGLKSFIKQMMSPAYWMS